MGKHRDRAFTVWRIADDVLRNAVRSDGVLDCPASDLVDWAFEVSECAARKGYEMLAVADAKDAEEKAGE